MSTTVPYWSNMQTLMLPLSSSAVAIAFPSRTSLVGNWAVDAMIREMDSCYICIHMMNVIV
jgi:hypothetical protein